MAILTGADVFRLNFSHGTHEEHRRRLDLIRAIERDTYGLDYEEFEEHTICMATPIFDHWNSVMAGLSVSIPEFRFDPTRMDEYGKMVIAAGRVVSLDLGCSTYPPDQD